MSKSKRRDRHGKKKTTHATDQQTNRPTDQQTNRPTDQKTKRPKDQKTKSKHGYDAAPLIDWAIVGEWLGLSGREIDIARLLCQGRKAAAMARELGISVNTVTTHLKRLYKKCHVHDRASLVMLVLSAASADHS